MNQMMNYTYECYRQIEIIQSFPKEKRKDQRLSSRVNNIESNKRMNKNYNKSHRRRGSLKQPGGASCDQRR